MDLLWDKTKNKKLKATRDISFEDVAQIILEKRYVTILENPVHPRQRIFVVNYKGTTYVIPFVIDAEKHIVLKTIFPSRRFYKLYGEEKT